LKDLRNLTLCLVYYPQKHREEETRQESGEVAADFPVLTSVEPDYRLTLKQGIDIISDILDYLWADFSAWLPVAYSVKQALLMGRESQHPNDLSGVVPLHMEILIFPSHHKGKRFLGALHPDPEIEEGEIKTHEFLKGVIQVHIHVEGM
jgi:hypothetical protein